MRFKLIKQGDKFTIDLYDQRTKNGSYFICQINLNLKKILEKLR